MQSLDESLNTLVPIVQPVVKAIEASIQTTKDHYGDYMTAITKIAGMIGAEQDKPTCLAIAVALQRAGANKAGVQAACRVMGII